MVVLLLLGAVDPRTGGVTAIQRFGGALNLNVHFHSLLPDGVFLPSGDGPARFMPIPRPSDEDQRRALVRAGSAGSRRPPPRAESPEVHVRVGTVAAASAGILLADVATAAVMVWGLSCFVEGLFEGGASCDAGSGILLMLAGTAGFLFVPPAAGVYGVRLRGARDSERDDVQEARRTCFSQSAGSGIAEEVMSLMERRSSLFAEGRRRDR